MSVYRTVPIALLVSFVTACGGGDNGTSYSLSSTVSCLGSADVSVSTDEDELDPIAEDAGAGALEAEFDANTVTIIFERSEGDAERKEASLQSLAQGFDAPTEDILGREGNAVIAWDKTPTDEEASQVTDCLGE